MPSETAHESPLRVALVTTELRPGGAERALASLAIGVDRGQFSPQVYSLAAPPPAEQATLVEQLRAADVPVHFLGVTGSWQFFTAVRRLRQNLREQSPQIVQAFLFHANIVSALAAGELNVPVLAGLRVAQREMLRQFVQRRLAERFAGFVCVSEDVARQAIEQGRLPAGKVHVIPNGVDVAALDLIRASIVQNSKSGDRSPHSISKGGDAAVRRSIVFVGRLEPQKGADVLLSAAEIFLPQLPEHELILVGDGPQRQQLQTRVSRGPLASRVHFAGWNAEPSQLLAASDLVVIPSRWEGMSNVLLEAMACGKAVVASDVEGMRQALGPAAEDQLVSPKEPQQLADRIVCLARNCATTAALGERNRERVAAFFSSQLMIDAYGRLWRETALV